MAVYLNTEDAAGVLGVRTTIAASKILRERGVRNQTVFGEQNSYTAEDVVRVVADRRAEALERHGRDEVAYARKIATAIRPPAPATVVLSDGRRVPRDDREVFENLRRKRGTDALTMLGADPAMVFGPGVIQAAAVNLPAGTCRTCLAFALTPWGAVGPEQTTAAVLLGKPCLGCIVKMTPKASPRPAVRSAVVASARRRTPAEEAQRCRAAAAGFRSRGNESAALTLEATARKYEAMR